MLQTGGQVGGSPNCGVEPLGISFQGAHHYGTRVYPEARIKRHVWRQGRGGAMGAQPLLQLQRRQHRTPSVVFMRQWGPKQGHKPFAGVVGHSAFVALHGGL